MAEQRQFRGERDQVSSRKKICILVAISLERVWMGLGTGGGGYFATLE